ncbi:hypothetical protein [Arthrobacter sp. Soil762]|uniref:hypothetical protein n=1 Tax=Arthrobacter sp. Soil762 TaxID=1736401 RepID=UPI00070195C9|nr:hypothetical protein [Arthrobacter sp. Soil762]KRE71774.1 hypothetical protein ASG77_12270 [Arthrobacter sp. Soil762]
MAEDTGTARASSRSSAAKADQAKDEANGQTEAADLRVAEAVARALGEQLSGAIREVFTEQRDIFAGQAALREADYVLVREMVKEQRDRRDKDAELLKKIEQAETRRPEPATTRRIDAEPGQLRLGLQFNALSNVLGSRKRTRVGRDDSLIPPPEIRTVTTSGKQVFALTFTAPLPAGAVTVGIQYLDNNPKGLVRVEKISGNSLDLASDQVQFVELLDGRAVPIAYGIPYRR